MSTLEGIIREVVLEYAGGSVEAGPTSATDTEGDYTLWPVGSTGIQLDDCYDFEEGGGEALIRDVDDEDESAGTVVSYTGYVDETDTLLLASPLAVAVREGVEVRVLPLAYEKRALVESVDDPDAELLPARVPFAMNAVLQEGMRDDSTGYESVGVTMDQQDWVIEDIVGEPARIDGQSVFIPGTEPETPLSDGLAPATSPTPVVVGGPGTLYVKVPAISNPDPVTVDVWASDTSPVARDAAHYIGSTVNGGAISFSEIGGAPISSDVTYFVAAVARDRDGASTVVGTGEGAADFSAIFPVTSTEILDNAISTPKLQANAVTAQKVAADVMIVNSVFARDGVHIRKPGLSAAINMTPEIGFQQTDSAGRSRVSFPSDPNQKNVINSDLVTQGLTVDGRASFRGFANEISRNSTLTLAVGTTRPSSALGGATGAWAALGTHGPIPEVPRINGGFFDGTDWIFMAAPASPSAKPRIARLSPTGAISYTTLSSLPTPTSSNNYYEPGGGVVKIGADYYVTVWRRIGEEFVGYPTRSYVYVLNSSFAVVRSWSLGDRTTFHDQNDYIATDGTTIWTNDLDSTDDDAANWKTRFRRWTTTGTLSTTLNITGQYDGHFLAGNFDFGAARLIVRENKFFGANEFRSYTTAGVAQPTENFQATRNSFWSGVIPKFWGWNGSRFVVWPVVENDVPQAPLVGSTRKTELTIHAGYTWYDSDTTGGTHETELSPVGQFTLPARAGAITLSAPLPADDGSADAPDSSRLYIGATAATLGLQTAVSPFVGDVTVEPNTTTGASPPTRTTCPPQRTATPRVGRRGTTLTAAPIAPSP